MNNDNESLTEIATAVRALGTTVNERVRKLEQQVARQASGRPNGFTPGDANPGNRDEPLACRQRRATGAQ